MTRKRKCAPLQTDEHEVNDAGEHAQRPAPNTNFLGRLMRGVATGNQRQIDSTTTNAANLSIGATGAASLRLQLQRAANARAPHYAALRRVVLSSAEQQRLTLCSALLAEVAQGFGFRLNVRWPDGQEIGTRQAMNAAASAAPLSRGQTPASEPTDEEQADDEDAEGTEPEPHADAPSAVDAPEEGGSDGVGGVPGREATADLLDALEPLDVGLEMDVGSDGLLSQVLRQPQQRAAVVVVGSGVAKPRAAPAGGSRSMRPGIVLTGRLTSAAFGSIGLVAPKTASQAPGQAASRRVAAHAETDDAAQGPDTASGAGLTASPPAEEDEDDDWEEEAEEDHETADAAGGDEPRAGGASGRHIVWNPAIRGPPAVDSAAASEDAAPHAKRARTDAGAGADGGEDEGGEVSTDLDIEDKAARQDGDAGVELKEQGAAEASGGDGAADDLGAGAVAAAAVGTATVANDGSHGTLEAAHNQEEPGDDDGQEAGENAGKMEDEVQGAAHQPARQGSAAPSRRASPAPAVAARIPGAAPVGSLSGSGSGAAAGGSGSGRQRHSVHAVDPGGTGRAGSEQPPSGAAVADAAGPAAPQRKRAAQEERTAGAGPGIPRSRASGAGPLGSPAGKLFGAAMRQLQQRRGQT